MKKASKEIIANRFIDAYIKAKNDSEWADCSDAKIRRMLSERYAHEGNIIETAKKWLSRNDFKCPQPEHCLQLEEFFHTEPGFFSRIFGYLVQYDYHDCKIIKQFYVDNIRNSNKPLVYTLIGASDKGCSKEGISIQELIDENPEIILKKNKLEEIMKQLVEDNVIQMVGEEKYSVRLNC